MKTHTESDWEQVGEDGFRQLAETYGTPFYLYDTNVVFGRINAIRKAFDDTVHIYYAVKANPNLALLKSLRSAADGLDISSGGELEQAVAAGFAGANLSFAGPAKSTQELQLSIEQGVGNISIESPRELKECIDIAKATDKKAQVVLRINPKHMNRSYGLKMGGRAVQFGVDEEQIDDMLTMIQNHQEQINFHGIHVYAGSQGFDADEIAAGVRDTFRIAGEIEKSSTLVCKTINLGGGFGVSHSKKGVELDIEALAAGLLPDIIRFQKSGPGNRKIVFELGRYLIAEAGIYVSKILSSKASRGKQFYMVDGGLHHHLSAAGTFGTALRSNFVSQNITRPNAPTVKCNIAGPSCNPTDLLGVNIELPRPELGDLLGILSSGSYGFTASPLLFLGRKTPCELIKIGNKIELARKSLSMQDFN